MYEIKLKTHLVKVSDRISFRTIPCRSGPIWKNVFNLARCKSTRSLSESIREFQSEIIQDFQSELFRHRMKPDKDGLKIQFGLIKIGNIGLTYVKNLVWIISN